MLPVPQDHFLFLLPLPEFPQPCPVFKKKKKNWGKIQKNSLLNHFKLYFLKFTTLFNCIYYLISDNSHHFRNLIPKKKKKRKKSHTH